MNQDYPPHRRPTVLQVVPRLKIGGAERVTVDLARALVEAGGDVVVAAEDGPLAPELLRAGASHIEMPVASKSPLTMCMNAARLARLIHEKSVDLVHVHSRAPAWSARRATRRMAVPLVTTFHAQYSFGSEVKKRYNGVMARGDRVIAVSDAVARHVRTNYRVGDERLRRIHNGVDVVRFDPAAIAFDRVTALAAQWHLPDGVPVVMFPGRLARRKAHHVMIQAMAELASDAICVMVGVGIGREKRRRGIERNIADRGLQDRVILIDSCDDMPAAYRLADVVVSASTESEGLPLVLIEAQAMGVPVVTTTDSGATEAVEHGVTGWHVPPGDPGAIARALRTALSLDTDARVRHAAIARAHVVERFTRSAMCRATLDVYRELVNLP